LGAGLGVAALAIPGVGPLAAIGAIAATVMPEAMAIGAVAGAAAGTFNEALKEHGVSDEDASYYGGQMKQGGVLVTVNSSDVDQSQAQDVLYRHGGHSSSRARNMAM
jgi:type IV secretory pathway TrbL component